MSELPIGSEVTFYFSTHPPITGIVKNAPRASGGCWIVEVPKKQIEFATFKPAKIMWIQQFDYMECRQPERGE